MDIKQVNSAIMFNSWTDMELRSMIDAIKFARASLQKAVKRSLMVGDAVEFTNSKTGRVMSGFVTKIAIKYVTVNVTGALWRVPANMLRSVDTETV